MECLDLGKNGRARDGVVDEGSRTLQHLISASKTRSCFLALFRGIVRRADSFGVRASAAGKH